MIKINHVVLSRIAKYGRYFFYHTCCGKRGARRGGGVGPPRLGLTLRGRVNKEASKDELLKTFRIFGRPFEAVRVDYRGSRRGEGISTGRVRPGSAPRGPGDIFRSDTLMGPGAIR